MFSESKYLILLLCFAASSLQMDAMSRVSTVLKRQSLIFHEPPVENILEKTNPVTEHYITQRLDNFSPQDTRTFRMVFIIKLITLKTFCLKNLKH